MNESAAFDRDFTLADLFGDGDAAELHRELSRALGCDVAIVDAAGSRIDGGAVPAGANRAPLVVELEPIAYLAADAPASVLAGAARTVRWGMLGRARYRMVTDLHLEAVRADYAKLQARNDELKASESRYRGLADSLDKKVKEQMRVLEERQRQLYQAERLSAIGQLAAGVAHEINNPLGFAISNLASAKRYLDKISSLKASCQGEAEKAWAALDLDFVLEDFAGLLGETVGGLDRISRIVKDLKGFSSVDQPEEQVADINELLESLCQVIGGQKKPGVELVREFGEVPRLLCLPGHLGQALLNLLNNALHAVGEQGRITVRTMQNGDNLRVQIIDTGVGMSDEVRERAFEPFFTTRSVGKGTGLGLTVARDIVLAHTGSIHLDSREGEGTTVTLDFPV